ncbi:MAG: T9SS type A sorting domain-containing protein, partial [Bacteroidales bacterium]|nr:T9SS type A sorting domain-containing protein [Bacteroidales bacterium]
TLTWNGEAEKYRVVVRLGADTVRNEVVAKKSYELKGLEAGIYSWAVASICKGGLAWATGDDFEVVKPLANEGAEGLAFRIYPNPTTGVFYVEVAEGARMEIFTVGGVMIRNAELSAGKNELRLENSGIYFVRLSNAHGEAVKRVVVR